MLLDGDMATAMEGSEDECHFGMTFKTDFVGVLDQAKVFIKRINDKSLYEGKLFLQGSNDGWATHDDVHMFGSEVHEGWNIVNFFEANRKPAYNSYRFFGSEASACKVTEYYLHGVETIESYSDEHQCTPQVIVDGEALEG